LVVEGGLETYILPYDVLLLLEASVALLEFGTKLKSPFKG
jgi:hypothetical protein